MIASHPQSIWTSVCVLYRIICVFLCTEIFLKVRSNGAEGTSVFPASEAPIWAVQMSKSFHICNLSGITRISPSIKSWATYGIQRSIAQNFLHLTIAIINLIMQTGDHNICISSQLSTFSAILVAMSLQQLHQAPPRLFFCIENLCAHFRDVTAMSYFAWYLTKNHDLQAKCMLAMIPRCVAQYTCSVLHGSLYHQSVVGHCFGWVSLFSMYA